MLDLPEKYLKIVTEILEKTLPPSLEAQVRVFGSRAQGRAKPSSDIDLSLERRNGGAIPFDILLKLSGAFEESDLPLFVDVVDFAAAPPALQEQIRRSPHIIWTFSMS